MGMTERFERATPVAAANSSQFDVGAAIARLLDDAIADGKSAKEALAWLFEQIEKGGRRDEAWKTDARKAAWRRVKEHNAQHTPAE